MNLLDVFETRPCPRCGGSGLYSFHREWGHTCFRCGFRPGVAGHGRIFTKRGAAAYDFYRTLLPRKKVRDLQIGDEIRTGSVTPDGKPYEAWYRVVEIRHEHRLVGKSLADDGSWIESWGDADILVERGSERITLSGLKYDSEFTTKWPDAKTMQSAVDKALAYQATLTKRGTVRKARPRKGAA